MNIHIDPGTVEVRGGVSILNVGDGDTKIVFDPNNEQERLRAARIVTDMLRRGYSLLVEDPPGSNKFVRVKKFDEAKCEYIIADFDSAAAAEADATEDRTDEQAATTPSGQTPAKRNQRKGDRPKLKHIAAGGARAVAVGRSAGG